MSGKSKEEIAFELVSKLKGVGVWGENNMKQILDMYSECLEATSGRRHVPGVTKPAAQPVAQPVAQSPAQFAAAPAQQPAPQPAVRQQQQMVQQAYQQPR